MKKKLIMLAVVVLSGSLFAGCGKSETSCPDGQILENGACKACPAGQKPNASKTACEIDLCGNGKVDSGEKCDKTIPAGKKGACPTEETCNKESVGCSRYELAHAGTCQAECVEKDPITEVADGDGCCPDGKTFSEDKDCGTPIGIACTGDEQCQAGGAGLVCFPQQAGKKAPKGGMCSQQCGGPGATTTKCPGVPGSSACVALSNKYSACFATCEKNSDCRDGYICFPTSASTSGANKGVCRPIADWCDSEGDCDSQSEYCKPADKTNDIPSYCAPWGRGNNAPGAGCSEDKDCGGGKGFHCHKFGGSGARKGICTKSCASSDGGEGECSSSAGELTACIGFRNQKGQTVAAYCMKPCSGDSDCSGSGFAEHFKCVDKICQFSPEKSTATTVGDSCTDDPSCGGVDSEGVECLKGDAVDILDPFKDGYCTVNCGDFNCPSGSVCDGLSQKCLKTCTAKSDCREGYDCLTVSTDGKTKACIPPLKKETEG